MDLGIKHKVALITGADNDLAAAVALELAREGAQIILASQRNAVSKAILKKLGGPKKGHRALVVDLDKPQSAKTLFRRLKNAGPSVGIVVNCLDLGHDSTEAHISVHRWRKIFRSNLEVAIEINNCFIPHMKAKGWGRIVNLSSGASMEHAASIAYCTSKAALTAYTRCMGRVLALEGGEVVMSAVLPGAIWVQDGHWQNMARHKPDESKAFLAQSPLGLFGRPEEVSPMVALLCSAQATYCHGAIVPIEGGQARHYFQAK